MQALVEVRDGCKHSGSGSHSTNEHSCFTDLVGVVLVLFIQVSAPLRMYMCCLPDSLQQCSLLMRYSFKYVPTIFV